MVEFLPDTRNKTVLKLKLVDVPVGGIGAQDSSGSFRASPQTLPSNHSGDSCQFGWPSETETRLRHEKVFIREIKYKKYIATHRFPLPALLFPHSLSFTLLIGVG